MDFMANLTATAASRFSKCRPSRGRSGRRTSRRTRRRRVFSLRWLPPWTTSVLITRVSSNFSVLFQAAPRPLLPGRSLSFGSDTGRDSFWSIYVRRPRRDGGRGERTATATATATAPPAHFPGTSVNVTKLTTARSELPRHCPLLWGRTLGVCHRTPVPGREGPGRVRQGPRAVRAGSRAVRGRKDQEQGG